MKNLIPLRSAKSAFRSIPIWAWVFLASAVALFFVALSELLEKPASRIPMPPPADAAPTAVAKVPRPAPAPKPKPETDEEHVARVGYPAAIEHYVPLMTDTRDEESDGALLFAGWASEHLAWSDIAIKKNETSFGLARKDPDQERGKRMCASGSIVQIEMVRLPNAGKVSAGLLMTDSSDILHFVAAGSSGTLVQDNYARFCGVVAGKYDYANSGGGTSHAIEAIGMFDLPENKPRKP